jgi:hypothetical protein
MKAYLAGMCDGCLRVVKKKKTRLGAFIRKSATRSKKWSVTIPHRSWRGQIKGLHFYPTFSVKQSGLLKEVTPVMESEPTR